METCIICIENCDFKLDCNHYCHPKCLKYWLELKNIYKCPYCTCVISFNDIKKIGIDIDINYFNNLLQTNNEKYILDMINNYNLEFNETTVENCIRYCSLNIIKQIYTQFKSIYYPYYAAKYNKLEILKWLKEENNILNEKTFEGACESNNSNVIEYLLEEKCKYDYNSIIATIKNNNITLFHKLIKDCSCKNNENIILEAVRIGNLEIINWLIDNDYMYNLINVFNTIIRQNNIELLKFFKSKVQNMSFKTDDLTDLFYTSLESRNLRLIIYIDCNFLNKHSNYADINTILNYAIINDCSIEIIRWLIKRYNCNITDNVLSTAKDYNDNIYAQLLELI